MRTHALLPVVFLGAVLIGPSPAGAADRHAPRRGVHSDYRSSRDHGDRYRTAPPRYARDPRGRRSYARPAPRRYSPPSRYRYHAPRYRYYGSTYSYRPYPRVYYGPVYPAPVYPYGGYYPVPPRYRTGVHGGVHLGFPGFGLSLYF